MLYPQSIIAGNAVDRQQEGGVDGTEVVGGELHMVHLLVVGVHQLHLQLIVVRRHLGLETVAEVGQHSHMHGVAGLVDGPVGTHLCLQGHLGGIFAAVTLEVVLQSIAVALGNDIVAPTPIVNVKPVAPVAVGDRRGHHLFLVILRALHAQRLSHDGTAGASVKQPPLLPVHHQRHVGAVQFKGHKSVGLEVHARRCQQHITARLEGRKRDEALGILIIHSTLHRPLAADHHRLCQQSRLKLRNLDIFQIPHNSVPNPVYIAVMHTLQVRHIGNYRHAVAIEADPFLLDLVAQVGTVYTVLTLGRQRDGGVAVAHSLHIILLVFAIFCRKVVKPCVIRTLGAAKLVDGLLEIGQREVPVRQPGPQFEQACLVPDADVVAVVSMEVDQQLLQVVALLPVIFIILRLQDNNIVGRGSHYSLLPALAVLLDALHRRLLQHVAVDEGRVILAEKGIAEGLLERRKRGQQRTVACLRAVVGILLVEAGGLRHVVGSGQPVSTDGALRVHSLGQRVGALVRALAHQLVEPCPRGLRQKVQRSQ